ncbi:protein clueless-like isoform X2 [Montipora capricornis]
MEWDCTALFQATIFAKSFAIRHRTLSYLYLKPRAVPKGSFHASVLSPGGNGAETFALAIDQLRRLRNVLCHSTSPEMHKTTFDLYIQRAKDAFSALGVSTARIDAIGSLNESDFPTSRVHELEQQIRQENQSYIKWLEGVSVDIGDIKESLESQKAKIDEDVIPALRKLILKSEVDNTSKDDEEQPIILQEDTESKPKTSADGKTTEKYHNEADTHTCTSVNENSSLISMEYPSALAAHQLDLHTTRKLYGEDNGRTADSYHRLGITQRELRDLPSAIDSHQRALKITKKLFGEEHPRTADNYHQLGITQRDFGDYNSALDSHQRDLHASKKLYGEDNGRTAYSYHQLGITQRELRDLPSAIDSHQRALNITRKLFGEEHPRTADNYHQLGITQRDFGDYNSALDSHQRDLHASKKLYGEDNGRTAYSYHQLGITQRELRDLPSALDSHQRALHITRNLFGEEHPRTVENYHQLRITQREDTRAGTV